MTVKYSYYNAGKFDFVFAGATFLAAGAACELQSQGFKCLITDRLALPGHEFASALKGGCPKDAVTARGKGLLSELIRRGAADGNSVNHAALVPLLCRELSSSGVEYYPFSNIVSFDKRENGVCLTLSCHGCEVTLTAGLVVDTTNNAEVKGLFGLSPVKSHRSINLMVTSESGESIVPFALKSDDYRRELLDAVLCGGLGDRRVISPADEPDETVDEPACLVFYGLYRAPSAAYDNAVTAYDAGAMLAKKLVSVSDENISSVPDMSHTVNDGYYDLIVAGLGTAGALCALSAARHGLSVLGIEKMSYPGGTGTAGGVFSCYQGTRGGSYTAIDSRAAELQQLGFVRERGNGAVTKSFALEEALRKAGVTIAGDSDIVGVIKAPDDDCTITGIRYIHKGLIHSVTAKTVADATGDGLVCLLAGCEMLGGRDTDNAFQIFSNVMRIYNRDTGTHAGKYADEGRVFQYHPGEFGKAVIHSSISPLLLPEKYRNGKYIRLVPVPLPGIREGARIVGEKTVRIDDITDSCRVYDPAFFEHVNLDNHGKDTAFENRGFRDWIEICSLWGIRLSIPIPVGALIPRGYSGLIAVGRCLSVDHSSAFAVRMKDAMQKCGEAGGILAAAAQRLGCRLKDVPYDSLKKEFFEAGILSETETQYTARRCVGNVSDEFQIPDTSMALRKTLSENAAGAVVRELSHRIGLRPFIEAHCKRGGLLALNSALSLSLMPYGCSEAVEEIVVAAVSDKSGSTPESSYTFNFPYAIAAISASGRCKLKSAADPLINIIQTRNYTADIPVDIISDGKTGLFYSRDDVEFVWFTSAVVALYSIAEAHPCLHDRISEAVSGLDRSILPTSISLIGQPAGYRMDMSATVNAVIDKIISLKENN